MKDRPCFICLKTGHLASKCPEKKGKKVGMVDDSEGDMLQFGNCIVEVDVDEIECGMCTEDARDWKTMHGKRLGCCPLGGYGRAPRMHSLLAAQA